MPKNDTDPDRTLRKLIKGFRVAMLTTITPGGGLRSRPMATVRAQGDGDVWFLTRAEAPKVDEVQENQRVNIGYASPKDGRYVSLSGTATVVKDPQRVQDLWRKRHRRWFPAGKQDPYLAALRVRIDRAEYWDEQTGQMMALEPAAAPPPANDDPGAVARAADAMKALVTGSDSNTEEKPPSPGGAQG